MPSQFCQLGGEGAEATLNGLYLAVGDQHVDNHTILDHAMPHCPSHELYKGILGGRAQAVFNVKLETTSVSKGARKTIGSIEVLAYGTAVIPQKTTQTNWVTGRFKRPLDTAFD